LLFFIYRLKILSNTAAALRKDVVKANGELVRLMTAYELAEVEVIQAPTRADMSTWLASDRPRRRAAIPHSPSVDLTQSTDASNFSQLSGEGVLSDDYTGSDASSHGRESMEERSVNTETGMPDTQMTDETFSPEEKKRRKREKKMKKKRKESKREEAIEEGDNESDGSGNSTQY
jgi:hypothetical protein